ncbi:MULTISPECIES: replication-associated recombination protein A [unclassified Fusibacter]|uniref:replication-associated recombination protein A n=1 Tax=unclassified Fusibacter TaxID=2624464 RepID=UPI0010115D9E|nr:MULTISPECIES: replication-associated recombination protein A [unclassified Fusibacter]MCK8059016.1 replication-associated recombination protein A [Fusibacter sp. A2]NPE22427.1 replication-associated recombination protein A [Fusibacter sp. A1]RXV60532.1 replication-associated recombination protein A [Fusibacter sp. A1]
MNLLDMINDEQIRHDAPLAERMKPASLDEFVGQESVLGEGTLLRRMIKADQMRSIIFYGPTGVGKTSIARIIAKITSSQYLNMNAVTSGIKDIKEAIAKAEYAKLSGQKTILFIDEIHRFNKAQQDALLPYVENGVICLIGATTENPYFEVNGALISRTMVFRLEALDDDQLTIIIKRALSEPGRGLADYHPIMEEEAISYLANFCYGDARKALNALELAVLSTDPNRDGDLVVTLADIKASFQRKDVRYDKGGDQHYDIVSAFIKSIRGSDPDAALHYMARMIAGGEDPMFIVRRIVISAAEDIGNANPMALVVATAAADAIKLIGMPEGRIVLSQAVTYLASSPKSNKAYAAIGLAQADVETKDIGEVPSHLKDASYKSAKKLGHGVDYKYPHAYDGAYVKQQYMPEALQGASYYDPSDRGEEKHLKAYLNSIQNK